MNSIYLLVPLSVVLVAVAVWAFFWAVDRGQFEDLDDPGLAALEEDAPGQEAPDRVAPGSEVPAQEGRGPGPLGAHRAPHGG